MSADLTTVAQARPTFASLYAMPASGKRNREPRLLECIAFFMEPTDPDYTETPDQYEFAVLDSATWQKGIFTKPEGYNNDRITGMIQQTFGVTARHIARGLWLV